MFKMETCSGNSNKDGNTENERTTEPRLESLTLQMQSWYSLINGGGLFRMNNEPTPPETCEVAVPTESELLTRRLSSGQVKKLRESVGGCENEVPSLDGNKMQRSQSWRPPRLLGTADNGYFQNSIYVALKSDTGVNSTDDVDIHYEIDLPTMKKDPVDNYCNQNWFSNEKDCEAQPGDSYGFPEFPPAAVDVASSIGSPVLVNENQEDFCDYSSDDDENLAAPILLRVEDVYKKVRKPKVKRLVIEETTSTSEAETEEPESAILYEDLGEGVSEQKLFELKRSLLFGLRPKAEANTKNGIKLDSSDEYGVPSSPDKLHKRKLSSSHNQQLNQIKKRLVTVTKTQSSGRGSGRNLVHERDKSRDTKFRYYCICGKSYPTPMSIYQHVRYYGERKIECTYCHFRFPSTKLLRTHLKNVHNKTLPPEIAACTFCGKLCNSLQDVAQHQKETNCKFFNSSVSKESFQSPF